VEAKLSRAGAALLARALPELAAGRLAFEDQDPAGVTFCRRLEKEDGRLDFAAPAPVLAARINGLFPWPACSADFDGQTVKLGLADALSARSSNPLDDKPAAPAETCHTLYDKFRTPGTVLGADAAGLLVATGQGVLRLRRMQRPGGRMLSAADFLRGFPVASGSVLPSAPMTEFVARRAFPRRPVA
jgi:methionyl-tRNA formyltransferase